MTLDYFGIITDIIFFKNLPIVKKVFFILLILSILLPTQAQKLPESWYRAQAALDNGNYSIALTWIDSALMVSPSNPSFWLKRGEIQYTANSYQSALADFQNAEKYRAGISSLWLARTYAQLSDTANAFAQLKIHLESAGKEPESAIMLDRAFSELSKTPQWKKLWLTDWYSPAEKLTADVAYHFSRQRWTDAIELLNQRIEGRSARHQLYFLRGQAYFNTGSYKAADADFAHALNKSKRNHEYLAWKAKTLLKQGKTRKAITEINHAIEYSGGSPEYYLIRSQALAANQQFEDATADILYFLSFYPNSIQAIELSAEYAANAGRYLTALSQLGKLIKTIPNEPKYYVQRGKIYMKSENWAMAEMDFAMSLDYDPNNADVYIQKGLCRYYQGNTSGACSDWKNALRLGSFQSQELLFRNCKE